MYSRIPRVSLIASLLFIGGQVVHAGEVEIRTLTECRQQIAADPNFVRRFVIPSARHCGEKDVYPSRLKIEDTLLGIRLVKMSARGMDFALQVTAPEQVPDASDMKTCVDVDPDGTYTIAWSVHAHESCEGRESGAVLAREFKAEAVGAELVAKEVCILPYGKCVPYAQLAKSAQDAVQKGLEPARQALHKDLQLVARK